jgi:hypothetical protein
MIQRVLFFKSEGGLADTTSKGVPPSPIKGHRHERGADEGTPVEINKSEGR